MLQIKQREKPRLVKALQLLHTLHVFTEGLRGLPCSQVALQLAPTQTQ